MDRFENYSSLTPDGILTEYKKPKENKELKKEDKELKTSVKVGNASALLRSSVVSPQPKVSLEASALVLSPKVSNEVSKKIEVSKQLELLAGASDETLEKTVSAAKKMMPKVATADQASRKKIEKKLEEEITKLQEKRNNPFLDSAAIEARIQILSRLLHLMAIPESFTEEQQKHYFGEAGQVDFKTLLNKVLDDDNQIASKKNPGKVANRDVVNYGLNAFKSNEKSSTTKFLDELASDFKGIMISTNNPGVKPREETQKYSYILRDGLDSLTDKGSMFEGPLGKWSGLNDDNSPAHSFSNGKTWADHEDEAHLDKMVRAAIAKEIRSNDPCDISDWIINNPKKFKELKDTYSVDASTTDVSFNKKLFSRTYAIGGLTAANWAGKLSSSLLLFITRFMLTTGEQMRAKRKAADVGRSQEEMKATKVQHWAGANDMITVNKAPTFEIADIVVKERLRALEEQILEGNYVQFEEIGLPDLSATPRYEAKAKVDPQVGINARATSEYLNRQLMMGCKKLQEKYPDRNIAFVDPNIRFKDALANPSKYGFTLDYSLDLVKDELPKKLEADKMYLQRNDNTRELIYTVIDPFGQKRSGTIAYGTARFESGGIGPSINDLEKMKGSILAAASKAGHILNDYALRLEGTFPESLKPNTIHFVKNSDGKNLDYRVKGPDGKIKEGKISYEALGFPVGQEPTLADLKNKKDTIMIAARKAGNVQDDRFIPMQMHPAFAVLMKEKKEQKAALRTKIDELKNERRLLQLKIMGAQVTGDKTKSATLNKALSGVEAKIAKEEKTLRALAPLGARGFMFNDDVHPSADMHIQLAVSMEDERHKRGDKFVLPQENVTQVDLKKFKEDLDAKHDPKSLDSQFKGVKKKKVYAQDI